MRAPVLPRRLLLAIGLFLAVSLLAAWGIYSLRDMLLQHTQSAGMAMARNFAEGERGNLAVYETLLSLGVSSLDTYTEQNLDPDMEEWLPYFMERMQGVIGKDRVIAFAVRNGHYIDARLQGRPAEFDPRERDWYRKAQLSTRAIYTGVYTDSSTGKTVITMAQRCRLSDTLLAFDIYPDKIRLNSRTLEKQEGTSYFFCDAAGNVLYKDSALDMPEEEMRKYLFGVVEEIRVGKFEDYDTYILDVEGNKRGVYYARLPNGWYSIVTIPYHAILQQINLFPYLLFLSVFVFLIGIIVLSYRTLRANALIERTNETVRVLGNSYYALYRIDFGRNTYEMIKGSDYLRARLPHEGSYSDLLDVMSEIIEPGARDEYRNSFSRENIRKLVALRIRDYGGDFRRLFGEEYRWVSVRVLFDESLAPNEVVLCFRDIQEEKKRQIREHKLLEDSLEAARRNEKAKQVFFSNVSHEMRTPLNAIVGMSELARKNLGDTANLQRYLDKINIASSQLKALIDDVLELSRMEQGRLALDNRETCLNGCIRECVSPYVVQAEMEGKTFTLDMTGEEVVVLADRLRIAQVLNNLLSNAFKFTKEGDSIRVVVTRLEQPGMAKYKFVVEDSGAGMSEDFLPRIFDPYMRESGFSTRHVSGTGLGMAITKNLVEQMNGEIHVRSTLGRGSTFTIILPFALAATPPAELESREQAASATATFNPDLLKGRRILLAEDNAVNMELGQELLAMSGMEVIGAWNGQEAVDRFAESEPGFFDAILMDMQMPVMDGCAASRAIRALDRPDAMTVPIIAVTANAFAEDIAATTASGMDAHVSKPIDFNILCQILERLMTKEA